MTLQITIEDVKDRALKTQESGALPPQWLAGFFRFQRQVESAGGLHGLENCFFYDLYVPSFVSNWPSKPSPPHPGVFADIFPTLLKHLVQSGRVLTLYVRGMLREHFNELEVIDKVLCPRGLRYALLSNENVENLGDAKVELGAGNLIFEWPMNEGTFIVQNWFFSPGVEIEGYISKTDVLPRIASLYFEPYRPENVCTLLSGIELGFRLWPDNNGLFLLSEAVPLDSLKMRLSTSELESHIQQVVAARSD